MKASRINNLRGNAFLTKIEPMPPVTKYAARIVGESMPPRKQRSHGDKPYQVQMCLNCRKPKCTNCHEHRRKDNKGKDDT